MQYIKLDKGAAACGRWFDRHSVCKVPAEMPVKEADLLIRMERAYVCDEDGNQIDEKLDTSSLVAPEEKIAEVETSDADLLAQSDELDDEQLAELGLTEVEAAAVRAASDGDELTGQDKAALTRAIVKLKAKDGGSTKPDQDADGGLVDD